jgi:hypothetical protein
VREAAKDEIVGAHQVRLRLSISHRAGTRRHSDARLDARL